MLTTAISDPQLVVLTLLKGSDFKFLALSILNTYYQLYIPQIVGVLHLCE